MITKEQAMTANEFHLGPCAQHVGPRGGIRLVRNSWRRSGKTKTWVTRPDDFRVPVKFGYSQHGYITQVHAENWHLPEDCQVEGNVRLEMYKRHYLKKGE